MAERTLILFKPDCVTKSHVGEVLARYKVPSQWTLQTDPLPRNAAGKVLKNILLERAGEEPSASTVDTAPQGEVP